MSSSIGSFFVVKRKANEDGVREKRFRLIGSYATKPNEDQIFARIDKTKLNRKRVIIQDFNTNQFKKFLSELPEKKTKIDDNPELENPLLGLDLDAGDFEHNVPKGRFRNC